jgi:hypothetical protein
MGGVGHVVLLEALGLIRTAETQEGRTFFGCGLLENVADLLKCSAASSDMAQPIIVAAATTENGAAVGSVHDHGARPYSRMPGIVKQIKSRTVS